MANILPTTMEYFDKLLGEQLLEGEGGGGGETWNTVFEGNISIDGETEIDGLSAFNADIIKVTFNGTEYTCERQIYDDVMVYYGATLTGGDYDFSTYPFAIYFGKDQETFIQTQTAGTYSLKIEEPQSGGSSDFSTAEVTIVNNTNSEVFFPNSAYIENGRLWAPISFSERNTGTVEAIMVEGSFTTYLDGSGSIQVSGDAEYDSEYGNITVYGDCTITIS